ncbi:MAG: alpha/beta hydrolase [Chloroflexi bacterium]|nr:alpha/beta hydrolase [Chloroflexota bacterium]
MPFIRANGLDVGYDVQGAGPPIVMLHGATSVGREDFAAQLPLISRAFLVHLPDARGHGRTRWDAADGFRYDWLVDDLEAFVDAIGLRSFHLLGFSMGAMTALQYAVRHPERLRTLVVIGISTEREPRASVARRLMDPPRILAADPAWAAELARRHDEGQGVGGWQRLLPAIAADIAVQPLLGPGDLHRIDAPTMVTVGDRDPFAPVDHAWGISRQIPRARLFVVPDCGHEVTVRRPGLFNEGTAGFYRQTEVEARRRAELVEGDAPGVAPGPATLRPAQVDSDEPGSLAHPAMPIVPGMDDTDARWLDRHSTGGTS